jgi:hypothetical protein
VKAADVEVLLIGVNNTIAQANLPTATGSGRNITFTRAPNDASILFAVNPPAGDTANYSDKVLVLPTQPSSITLVDSAPNTWTIKGMYEGMPHLAQNWGMVTVTTGNGSSGNEGGFGRSEFNTFGTKFVANGFAMGRVMQRYSNSSGVLCGWNTAQIPDLDPYTWPRFRGVGQIDTGRSVNMRAAIGLWDGTVGEMCNGELPITSDYLAFHYVADRAGEAGLWQFIHRAASGTQQKVPTTIAWSEIVGWDIQTWANTSGVTVAARARMVARAGVPSAPWDSGLILSDLPAVKLGYGCGSKNHVAPLTGQGFYMRNHLVHTDQRHFGLGMYP